VQAGENGAERAIATEDLLCRRTGCLRVPRIGVAPLAFFASIPVPKFPEETAEGALARRGESLGTVTAGAFLPEKALRASITPVSPFFLETGPAGGEERAVTGGVRRRMPLAGMP